MVFVCTEDDDGALIWMDKDSSTRILADRQAAADQKEADERAAAEAAEAQRIADDQALADAQAAEAQRLADEQAAQQYIPPEPPAPAPVPAPAPAPAPAPPAPAYYPNCTAARNAGAAPVYIGGPGYGTHLDRDGDGVGCE